jgi:hypothetical protein
MEVLIFLGLAGCAVWFMLRKLNESSIPPLHPFDASSRPPTLVDEQEEAAREFLREGREGLSQVYMKLAVSAEGAENPAELHDAFEEKWKEVCQIAEARYGELRVIYALQRLGFD